MGGIDLDKRLPTTILHYCLNDNCRYYNPDFPSICILKLIDLDTNGKCTYFDPINPEATTPKP